MVESSKTKNVKIFVIFRIVACPHTDRKSFYLLFENVVFIVPNKKKNEQNERESKHISVFFSQT